MCRRCMGIHCASSVTPCASMHHVQRSCRAHVVRVVVWGCSVLNVKQTLHTKVIHNPNLSTTLFHKLSPTLSTTCIVISNTVAHSIKNYIISIWHVITGYLYRIALHARLRIAFQSCASCYRACNLQRAFYGDFASVNAHFPICKNARRAQRHIQAGHFSKMRCNAL